MCTLMHVCVNLEPAWRAKARLLNRECRCHRAYLNKRAPPTSLHKRGENPRAGLHRRDVLLSRARVED